MEFLSFSLVGFDVNGVVSVRLRGESGGSTQDFYNDILVDDLFIGEAPNCLAPTSLSASNITANSADLSWAAGGTETAWDIQYGTSGFAPGSGTTVGVTTNPYSLTGLSASTTYDYYIKAICAPGDSSSWTGPFTFTTAFQCPPNAICAGPYNTGDIPSDRDFVLNGQTSTCPGSLQVVIPAGFVIDSIATMYDFTAQGGAWMSEQRSLLYLPSIGIGEPNAAAGTGGTSAGTESYARTTSFPIGLNVNGTVDIEIHAGRTWGGTGCNTQYNKIDDGTWMVIAYYGVAATCPPPSNLTVSNITVNSADLSWTAGGTETAWDIQYGTSGFAPGSGTTVGVTTNPYSLTGLSASTTYDYYIKAICAPGDSSSWTGPFTFSTISNPSCDYTINMVDSFGDGWNNASIDVSINGAFIASFANTNTTAANAIQTATFSAFTGDSVSFSFTSGSWDSEITFEILDPTLNSLTSGYIPAPTPGFFLADASSTSICQPPSCPQPSALIASNITANSADLSWTAGGTETAWDIQYGTSGFAPGSGTTVGVTTNPYSLTGLSASTTMIIM